MARISSITLKQQLSFHTLAIRKTIYAKHFLQENPQATVVSLGSGLAPLMRDALKTLAQATQ